MTQAAPAIAMIAAFALVIGGGVLIRRAERLKGTLMLAMAAVLIGNVLIWTL